MPNYMVPIVQITRVADVLRILVITDYPNLLK